MEEDCSYISLHKIIKIQETYCCMAIYEIRDKYDRDNACKGSDIEYVFSRDIFLVKKIHIFTESNYILSECEDKA